MRNFINRFWGKIIINPITDCWNWNGCKDKDGYGKLFFLGVHARAHRVSYTIYKGKVMDNYCVLHRCDNPSCVNPNHLFIGTHADNNYDRKRKNRNGNQNGILNNKVKLSQNNVVYILKHKEKKQLELANMFGVSQTCISKIRNGSRWSGGLF